MTGSDEKRLQEISARLHRDDPRVTRAPAVGRPCLPATTAAPRVWLLLVVALAVLSAGLVLAHGLLIAAGLVVAGMAGELFDSFPPDR
nr:DUF3040 domain-containing protein [Streptomyces chartreusis]